MNVHRYILLVLVFFPSVTFGVFSAEIFPWAMLFAVCSLRFVDKVDAALTAILICVLFTSASWSIFTNPQSDAIRSLAAYLNPILVFFAFLNISEPWVQKSTIIARRILVFVIFLGIGQFFGLLAPLEGLLSMLVPRASAGALTSMGGRGVTLLTSEPSRAGIEVMYMYLLYRCTLRPNRSLIPEDVGMILFLAIAIKAAQPFAFGVLAIGLISMQKWYHVLVILLGMSLATFLDFGESGSRVLVMLANISEMNLSEAAYFIANESGHRVLSIYAFFTYGALYPFGGGVGNWAVTSITAIDLTGIDISGFRYFAIHGDGNVIGIRGSGILSNLMLDGGLILTIFFLFWVFHLTKKFRRKDKITLSIMTILLFKITFIGSVGEPIPWVITALVLRNNFMQTRTRYGSTFQDITI